MPLMTATPPIFHNSMSGFAVDLTETPTWVPDHLVPEVLEAGGALAEAPAALPGDPVLSEDVVASAPRGRPRKITEG